MSYDTADNPKATFNDLKQGVKPLQLTPIDHEDEYVIAVPVKVHTYPLMDVLKRTQSEDDIEKLGLFKLFCDDDRYKAIEDVWLDYSICIAGGAVRDMILGREQFNDIDIFFADPERRTEALKFLEDRLGSRMQQTFFSQKAISLIIDGIYKVQLVSVVTPQTIEQLFATFDFTVAQFAITPRKGAEGGLHTATLHCGEYSLYDLGRKSLRLHAIHHPVGTVNRMMKYFSYGFRPCTGTVAEFLLSVADLEKDRPGLIMNGEWYID